MINYNPSPLTSELFDLFIDLPIYTLNAKRKINGVEELITDGAMLFNIVIDKLLKQGIEFRSPGNSMKRHFILWYNSHFSEENTYSHKVEVSPKHFDLICEIVNKLRA